MTEAGIPREVREFLLDCIDSVAQLEALLLLRDSAQEWDIPRLARRLYVGEAEAAQIMSALVACDLASTDGAAFRFHSRDADHKDLIEKVANTYTRCLVPVTQFIHEKGMRKFADAFKFKKGK